LGKGSSPHSPELLSPRVFSAYSHAHGITENKSHDNPRKNPSAWHYACLTHRGTSSLVASRHIPELARLPKGGKVEVASAQPDLNICQV
jgi:hypothetical protein